MNIFSFGRHPMKLILNAISLIAMIQANMIKTMTENVPLPKPSRRMDGKYEFVQNWLKQLPTSQASLSDEHQQSSTLQTNSSPAPTSIMTEKKDLKLICPFRACTKSYQNFRTLRTHAYSSHSVYLCICMAYFEQGHEYVLHCSTCKERSKAIKTTSQKRT